jgi:hypothetical protein
MKLYEITGQLKALEELDIGSAEDAEAMNELFMELNGTLEDKLLNIGKLLKNYQADVDTLEAEERRLKDRREAVNRAIQKVKDYVKYQMEAMDTAKVTTDLFTFTVAKNPGSLKIHDETLLPAKYRKEVVSVQIDNAGIKEALKSGESVPGAEIVQGTSLRIK